MTLHAYFHLQNPQAFQRLLNEGAEAAPANGLSSSGGRSWGKPSPLVSTMACDVNARDWLGMTVLHHACAGSGPTNLNFVRMLLAHPGINVNICDLESHWTPLHRAMYNGNLLAALLLLRRQDIDTSVKDFEGYTAFDLYNSTVEHSKPDASQGRAELYTWGANRNACLGQGDGNDRAFPDQVVIQPQETPSVDLKLEARFSPINVRGIEMSRLHTAIVTTEHKGNLRLCGFGSGGRLGPGQQAQQYALKPLAELSQYTIVSVALGQDHTLALTNTGEVLSWGLNRFAQLGYVIEPPSGPDMSGFARKDEPIQATPRKIPGSLKKAFVLGVAACKTASACWTSKEVFTWGTNHGQLGYDKSAQPIQIQPRVVTKLPFPAIDVALSDTAMICLVRLDNGTCNLYYLHNDVCSKLSFPPHAFPAQIYPYRPPQSTTNADIQKVTCCDDNFAALSANGEVFMFSFGTGDVGGARSAIKPQRVWALRKQFSAVKDVALGSDGSLIICTESGHVYVRTRSSQTKASGGAQDRTGGNKPFKFQRVPFLQRVVRVCANSTGAFGALKVGFQPTKIIVKGNIMQSDVRSILPCIPSPTPRFGEGSQPDSNSEWSHLHRRRLSVGSDDDNGEEDTAVVEDQAELARLCDYVSKSADHSPSTEGLVPLSFSANHGADMWIQVKLSKKSGITPMIIPVHRVLLAARSLPLAELLTTRGVLQGDGIAVRFAPLEYPETSLRSVSSPAALHFEGCLPLSVLILLVYLYSDRIIALWDTRIRSSLPTKLSHLAAQSPRVKDELRKFAKLVSLPHLATALESPAKRDPVPTLCDDLASSFNSTQVALSNKPLPRSSPSSPDVLLKLKDHQVLTHSTLLRARSLFFASMFDEEDWTFKRWGSNGLIEIDLTHLKWRPMQYVLRFLACGEDEEMFSTLNTIQNPDELLDLMFSVMAAANELLLDRLVLLCSSTILKFLTINNACYILDAAAFFHAYPLISSVQEYMSVNMETMLESHMLNDLSSDLIEQLSRFVQTKQAEKLPVSRSGILVVNAAFRHHDWLESQDIATPIVVRHSHRMVTRKASAKLSPSLLSKPAPMSHIPPSVNAPQSLPAERQTQADDIFAMDEPDLSTPSPAVWKASSVPRVDMKALMAEQKQSSTKPPTTPVKRSVALPSSSPGSSKLISPRMPATSSPWNSSRPSSGSPGRTAPEFPVLGMLQTPTKSVVRATSTQPKPPHSGTLSMPGSSQVGLGPVYAPMRQPSSSTSTPRRASSSKAWNSPPVQPPSTVVRGSGMSLVAIQQLELEQSRPQVQDKRSIVDIQREEQERQTEEDFLRWWASEEQRIKLESEVSTPPQTKQRGRGGAKNPRSSKKTAPKASERGG